MAAELLEHLNVEPEDLGEWRGEGPVKELEEDKRISETEKSQLIKARMGQGIYRRSVDDGGLILSKEMPEAVRLQWDVYQNSSPVPLSAAQVQYLNHHRTVLLRK
ncbi:hypothetical protein H8M10_20140 [Stenotrophomonas maltophilia]|uniref:hypothetical protein n=1 Tax=Bacteria TaxID=2 RepID=UPI000C15F867|nr:MULTISPECIES: hypothetical protein [Stenotrophomonas]EKU9981123.1 hypothetical protein [Stenotrophomonas maltophilia]EKX6273339.1 hypothetical protein [Stenotrophomonas maltophilia]MBH1721510.1 hypothetical protein [Stenotrophomonas maltophilia]MBH1796878.1 hypothetical protein [Stenotrophomonas maltophilia]MBH1889544.1 hypothetical protein [Stenotrophomonas maltophilia]